MENTQHIFFERFHLHMCEAAMMEPNMVSTGSGTSKAGWGTHRTSEMVIFKGEETEIRHQMVGELLISCGVHVIVFWVVLIRQKCVCV